MNNVILETFLSVISHRSISLAAVYLNASQSSVSSRIKQLEEELGGITLIERQKGTKEIKLTSYGKAFIPLAEHYLEVHKAIENFSFDKSNLNLTVACTDSLNTHIFRNLYQKLIHNAPHIDLRVRTHQSAEIYEIINNTAANIGFVFQPARYENLLTEHIFSEKMMLMLSKKHKWPDGPIHPSMLNTDYEVYLEWNENFMRWHDYWFPQTKTHYAQVDTASLLVSLIREPQSWAVCPISVAKANENNPNVIIRECAVEIPERITYMVTKKNASVIYPEIPIFREVLFNYLKELDYINLFEEDGKKV